MEFVIAVILLAILIQAFRIVDLLDEIRDELEERKDEKC